MPEAAIPSYDALYSISDLHLGGAPGMQMFAQSERLGGFLAWLAGTGPGVEHCALVLAGDVIDSLPRLSKATGYILLEEAADLVRSTFEAFHEVRDGLRRFVGAPGRELIVLIGNHDLELALPEAQNAFVDLLTGQQPEARARIRFATTGTGFRCRVGRRSIYVTHGNEADLWNHVDHEALRIAAHRRALGLPFEPTQWVPNAGTKLVVDAMNRIKKDYPFVDLLKPETGAMLKILAVLDTQCMQDFYAALPAFARKAQAGFWNPPVVLGTPVASTATVDATIRILTDSAEHLAEATSDARAGASALLERVLEHHKKDVKPENLVSDDLLTLNIVGRFIDLFRDMPLVEKMRRALLDWMQNDRTFDLADEDDTYRGVLSHLGSGIDVVITGHTHLPRWIRSADRSGLVYLNAGTWARTIGLPRALLEDPVAFETAYGALISKDIGDMDRLRLRYGNHHRERSLILDATLAAHVGREGVPCLVRVKNDGSHLETLTPTADPLSWQ